MRFRIECMLCMNHRDSPEGRKSEDLEAAVELCVLMGLACLECGGPVTMRLAPDAEGQ
jgi:hypothetical protein